MTPRQAELKNRRLREAMQPLVEDERFRRFMDLIVSMKDQAVELAAMHDTVKEERATIAALGAIRTYLDIIAVYENHQGQIDELRQRSEETLEATQQ